MTSVLVLGGTGWLSGLIAEEWRDRGADVTALARGGRAPADGIRLAIGDRDQPDAYDEVAAERWDEVVDITMNVAHARAAVAALADRTQHWTCVSTISVYADSDAIGADESAETLEPADPGSPGPAEEGYDYGRAKVAVEDAVRAGLGDRALIVRPGLIVGPGDVSDRFGYWVGRFALAADGPVLVPDLEGLGAQVIDVRDLAAFVARAGADAVTGTIDVVGDPLVLSDVLARARGIAGHTGELVERDDEWLERHDVSHWSGPRSLPLWLPHDSAGFMSRSNACYRAAGGAIRDLDTTLRDTLADEAMRGLDRERRSGLSRTEELALIADETPAAD